jgi:hypothetical protein
MTNVSDTLYYVHDVVQLGVDELSRMVAQEVRQRVLLQVCLCSLAPDRPNPSVCYVDSGCVRDGEREREERVT